MCYIHMHTNVQKCSWYSNQCPSVKCWILTYSDVVTTGLACIIVLVPEKMEQSASTEETGAKWEIVWRRGREVGDGGGGSHFHGTEKRWRRKKSRAVQPVHSPKRSANIRCRKRRKRSEKKVVLEIPRRGRVKKEANRSTAPQVCLHSSLHSRVPLNQIGRVPSNLSCLPWDARCSLPPLLRLLLSMCLPQACSQYCSHFRPCLENFQTPHVPPVPLCQGTLMI